MVLIWLVKLLRRCTSKYLLWFQEHIPWTFPLMTWDRSAARMSLESSSRTLRPKLNPQESLAVFLVTLMILKVNQVAGLLWLKCQILLTIKTSGTTQVYQAVFLVATVDSVESIPISLFNPPYLKTSKELADAAPVDYLFTFGCWGLSWFIFPILCRLLLVAHLNHPGSGKSIRRCWTLPTR